MAAQQAVIGAWQAGRAAGTGPRPARRPADPEYPARDRRARARLADLQAPAVAEAEAKAAASGDGTGKQPQRNVTDPDSRLMPVRGGGFIQGCNCQDAASDDRLMPGGYAHTPNPPGTVPSTAASPEPV